jgi:hypothetical protein
MLSAGAPLWSWGAAVRLLGGGMVDPWLDLRALTWLVEAGLCPVVGWHSCELVVAALVGVDASFASAPVTSDVFLSR